MKTPYEILRDALQEIQEKHGVAITSLDAEWVDCTHCGGIPKLICESIEIRAGLTEVIKRQC